MKSRTSEKPFIRSAGTTLLRRLKEKRPLIQVIIGPRQVGKTTMVKQVLAQVSGLTRYASAEAAPSPGSAWIAQQWETLRIAQQQAKGRSRAVLALDEIQKIPRWSETVKQLWDEEQDRPFPLTVLLLGSSSLLVQQGLSESMAGRFEVIRLPHWAFREMHQAFGMDLEEFCCFGGYPGGAALRHDESRWKHYIRDSLIETTISKDVLYLSRVEKPALLRRLFDLACQYSGRELTFQKMLGQLQDAGNTVTLAHYLQLLFQAGLVTGLQKFSGETVRMRASSPKLQVLNSALMTAQTPWTVPEMKARPEWWGRLIETVVGAHLANIAWEGGAQLYYWRQQQFEVDFVVQSGDRVTAIEVKSSPRQEFHLPGMETFAQKFPQSRKLLVGKGGIELSAFLAMSLKDFL